MATLVYIENETPSLAVHPSLIRLREYNTANGRCVALYTLLLQGWASTESDQKHSKTIFILGKVPKGFMC